VSRSDRRAAAQLPIVDDRRLIDVEGREVPELSGRRLEEHVIVDVRRVAFVVADGLRPRQYDGLLIPRPRLGPLSSEVAIEEEVVGPRLKGVIVRLVARCASVERELSEPVAGLFGKSGIRPPPRSDVALESSRLEKNPPFPSPRSGRWK
jgi:hypothetical protein